MARKIYINTKDIVELTGLTRDEVYALIREGKLAAHKAPKSGWRIEEDQVYAMFPHLKRNPHPKIPTRLISDREHYEFLMEYIRDARSRVLISTANMKRFSIGETEAKATSESFLDILEDLAYLGVEIRIISSSTSNGFLEEMKGHESLMKNLSFHFKTCRRCHMKMVLIDDEVIYIGSANITAAGMGPRIDTRRNFETGMISSDSSLVEQGIGIFDEVWSGKRCKECYYKSEC